MAGAIQVATTPAAHVGFVLACIARIEFARFILAAVHSGRQTIAAFEAASAGARTAIAEQTVAEVGSALSGARRLGQLRTVGVFVTTGAGPVTGQCGAGSCKHENTDSDATFVKDDVVATGAVVFATRTLQTHGPIAEGARTQRRAAVGIALPFGYVGLALSVQATWALGAQPARLTLRPDVPMRARGVEGDTVLNRQLFTNAIACAARTFRTKVGVVRTIRACALMTAFQIGITLVDCQVVLAGLAIDTARTFGTSHVDPALRGYALMNTFQVGMTLPNRQAFVVVSVVAFAVDTARTLGTKVIYVVGALCAGAL